MDKIKIAVIGLGYVGLPLAIEFGKKYKTVGYDLNVKRVAELQEGEDRTGEIYKGEFSAATKLIITDKPSDIAESNCFIITVPTPVDLNKQPDISYLISASKTVGKYLKKNDLVIYESTVYPGCTEEDCVPVLEKVSGLKYNKDFSCGYSPERINPGDKERPLIKIRKITSGSSDKSSNKVDALYNSIIQAGTYKASSIKVAEAAKLIENAQRDVNIAFINELAILFNKLGLDTTEVLNAASTKWNFLPFKPGLVGGHCIGVDPYYLAQKAQKAGFFPEITLAARRLNDQMGAHIASRLIKLMINKKINPGKSKVLILGVAFKENCPDLRNTKVVDIYKELVEFGSKVDIYDPWVNGDDFKEEYKFNLLTAFTEEYDGIILAVAHDEFKDLEYSKLRKKNSVMFDVKSFLPRELVDERL